MFDKYLGIFGPLFIVVRDLGPEDGRAVFSLEISPVVAATVAVAVSVCFNDFRHIGCDGRGRRGQ